jgi:hypothetical protein
MTPALAPLHLDGTSDGPNSRELLILVRLDQEELIGVAKQRSLDETARRRGHDGCTQGAEARSLIASPQISEEGTKIIDQQLWFYP